MLRPIGIVVTLFLLTTLGFALTPMPGDTVPDSFCISEEEYELYIMINEYRGNFHQPAIPLSKSLCFVARQHAEDLVTNYHQDDYPCSYNSWSDKGSWTPCCYTIKNPDYDCVRNKPEELTNYPGKGYELVYWENSDIQPKQAYEMWTAYNSTRSMLIGSGKWEDSEWNAMGVAIQGGYGIVWFGEKVDEEGEAQICSSDLEMVAEAEVAEESVDEIVDGPVEEVVVPIPVAVIGAQSEPQPEPEPQPDPDAQTHYIIAASFNSLESANSALVKYKTEGFIHAKVIITEDKYRICLDEFSSLDEARRIKGNLQENYPDAWILSQ